MKRTWLFPSLLLSLALLFWALQPSFAATASSLEKSATNHLAKEEFDTAIADCVEMRRSNPNNVELENSILLESVALYLKGDYEAAISKWKELTPNNPKLAAAQIFDPLQAPYNKAIATSPGDLAARVRRARFFRERADQKRYPNFYEEKSPLSQGGILNLIDLNILGVQKHSFYQSAYYDWTRAITIKDEPAFHAERALTGALLNQVADQNSKIAISKINDDLDFAMAKGAKDGETLRVLGRFYDEAGPTSTNDAEWRPMLQSSITFYSRALLADPTYLENDKIREARSTKIGFLLSSKPIAPPAVKPTTPLQWKERGNDFFSKSELAAALDCYDNAIKLDAKYADGYNNKGNIYVQIGAYDLAIKEFETAIALDPRHRVAYYNRSSVWRKLDETAKALNDADRAIQFAQTPTQKTDAINNRAEIYFATQRYSQALSDVNTLLALHPRNASAWTFRGQIELLLKNLPASISSLEKAAAFDVTKTQAKFLLLTAQYLKGDNAPTALEGKTEDKRWLARFLVSKQFAVAYSSDEEKARIKTLLELTR